MRSHLSILAVLRFTQIKVTAAYAIINLLGDGADRTDALEHMDIETQKFVLMSSTEALLIKTQWEQKKQYQVEQYNL